MAADVAQNVDIVELGQPLGIVDDDRILGAVAELQEPGEDLLDAVLVRVDLFKESAAWRLSSRPDGSPTRVVPPPIRVSGFRPRLLRPVQEHDLTSDPMCSEGAVQSYPT